ncbi:2927_t:CDS:2 [Funneliformis geosporum]|uniref:2927_t:CDS:1 n=1 Tax=Funneliformis geosporum TaxID=1117311 RepID=A0A9W4SB51_9GLOM|nr:2927_t:CDS:2 [Funneliformis geosporum]
MVKAYRDMFRQSEKDENHPEGDFECIRYNLKQQFYLIEGVDNLPLEATSSNSSQFNVPDSFAKVVGLNHKITIIPADSQGKPEKNKPVENNPNDNPFNSLPKELNDKNLLQYFQENNIKSIEKEGENLIVECNDNSIFIKSLAISPELKGIEKFLQNKNSKKISLQELSKPSDTSPPTKSPEKNNNL